MVAKVVDILTDKNLANFMIAAGLLVTAVTIIGLSVSL
jgi:hypothetical protein